MTCNHRIIALHPDTGEILPAVYKEDWFGEGKDAIAFHSFNGPNYRPEDLQWDFVNEASHD